VRAVVTAAKNGDMTAARIIIERLLPPKKDRPVSFALPDIASADDATTAMGALLAAVAAGNAVRGGRSRQDRRCLCRGAAGFRV
jgi:hypothetical protein